jgi:predicted nucleotidyltransferase
MNRDDIIATLRDHEQALRLFGVAHAALFGSVARGEATPASDIDIMVEIEPSAPVGVFEYVGIRDYIANLFEGPVDVVRRASRCGRTRRAEVLHMARATHQSNPHPNSQDCNCQTLINYTTD